MKIAVAGEVWTVEAKWTMAAGRVICCKSDVASACLDADDLEQIISLLPGNTEGSESVVNDDDDDADAWYAADQRGQFLRKVAAELFVESYRRCVDVKSMSEAVRNQWTEDVAQVSAEAAASLLIAVHNAKAITKAAGLDVG